MKKLRPILRFIAFTGSLLMAILIMCFALLSGSEMHGTGITAILKNSPNALPWFVYFILVLMVLKYRKLGSVLLSGYSLFLAYFFTCRGGYHYTSTIMLVIIINLFAGILLADAFARKEV